MRVAIELESVWKRYGEHAAVGGVSLSIAEGEFFSVLGPSGCGKTTTLRMIAGFVAPDEGRVLLQGDDVTTVSPNKRPVNMVFQQYALFPHMTVYERRHPRQLSGGQQQRVALARALVNRPAALLLDEPLGALDVKLRRHMQLELKRIQHELGTTFVYVTHDQEEALAMSDRIAVMNDGHVEQLGTPREIYEHPASAFVADFVGTVNVLNIGEGEISVRPERIQILREGGRLDGVVADVVYLGVYRQFHVDTAAGRVVSVRLADEPLDHVEPGSAVSLSWD